MTRRYCIERTDDGLYWLGGEWCEEPEWFDYVEAARILRGLRDPSPLAIRGHDFDPEEN
jgi:hypothetical protein